MQIRLTDSLQSGPTSSGNFRQSAPLMNCPPIAPSTRSRLKGKAVLSCWDPELTTKMVRRRSAIHERRSSHSCSEISTVVTTLPWNGRCSAAGNVYIKPWDRSGTPSPRGFRLPTSHLQCRRKHRSNFETWILLRVTDRRPEQHSEEQNSQSVFHSRRIHHKYAPGTATSFVSLCLAVLYLKPDEKSWSIALTLREPGIWAGNISSHFCRLSSDCRWW